MGSVTLLLSIALLIAAVGTRMILALLESISFSNRRITRALDTLSVIALVGWVAMMCVTIILLLQE